jgi:hypothetical protein
VDYAPRPWRDKLSAILGLRKPLGIDVEDMFKIFKLWHLVKRAYSINWTEV